MAKIKPSLNGTKKDSIIKKAAALFHRKGFRASSMRELAEALGVEAPSLYNHIGSKSELLQDICFKVADDFNDQLTILEQSGKTPAVKIEQLIRFHIGITQRSFDELYVANHEWKQLDDPFLGMFLAQRKLYEGRMLQVVKQGVQQGEFRNIHPRIAVLTILSTLRGLEFWQRHKKEMSIEQLEDNVVNHLLHGLIK